MKIIDLTHKIDETTLNFRGNIGCQFKTIWDYEQCTSKTKFKVQSIDISCGLGTHIDSSAHCFQNKKTVNEIATEFIYETVIIDCRNYCKESLDISFQNIKTYIEQNNLSIKNKFIILKTGWSSISQVKKQLIKLIKKQIKIKFTFYFFYKIYYLFVTFNII